MFGLTADQRSDSCPSRVAKPKSPIDEKEDNLGADKADKYAMTYGSSVKVGNAAGQNQPLSTNSYSNDRSGLLEEVQYGNGGKVKYSYDDFDRLEGVA